LTRFTFYLRGKIRDCIGNIHDEDEEEEEEEDGKEIDRNGHDLESENDISLPPARVSAISRFIQDKLYEGKGSIGANLVLGGYDYFSSSSNKGGGGAMLMAIHPHGSIDVVPYTALGSGGLAAMSVLESRYRSDMTTEEGIQLVKDAVKAGIVNDMGSGSQIDLCILDYKHQTNENKEGGGGGGAVVVTYKRAVVQEESLPYTEKEQKVDALLLQRHVIEEKDDEEIGGVNGFGSLPYSIKSKRMIMESEEIVEKRRRQWLETIID